MKHSSSNSITIVDVAREAGVSNATVSRVLNDGNLVKPETRQKVLNAMMRLGYVINQQARSLRGARSHVIGLLVHDIGNSYIATILNGVEDELIARQYDLLLYTTHRRKSSESAHVATITRGLADGLLISLPTDIDAYLTWLQQEQFPHVLIDYPAMQNTSTASVQATNWQGTYDATRYLIELGHRRLAFVTGLMEVPTAVERLNGFKAAMSDFGLQIDPNLIYEGDFFRLDGYRATKHFLSQSQPPTAIVASNDVAAFGVLDYIRDAGLQVPKDISVVGFDDIPEAMYIYPHLTTVRQPLEEMGKVAAQLLFKQLDNPDLLGSRVELPTQLVVRDSSGPPPSN